MTTSTKTMLADQMTAQANQFDEIYQEADPFEQLHEAPIDIHLDQQLTVVLCTGGPHVEAVATLDRGDITRARLEGYWAGEKVSWPVTQGTALWQALETYAQLLTD